MHTIRLKAIDSCQTLSAALDTAGILPSQYPGDWKLMAHQVETIQALRDDNAQVIINQAMTGDGKSLAAQFLALTDRNWATLLMYPTNELVRDQIRSLEHMLDSWPRQPWWPRNGLQIRALNAAELDALQDKLDGLARADTLNMLLDSDLTLTNPDIFHLMMLSLYRRRGAAADLVLSEVANRYRLFVFDEFHLFGAAQAAAAVIAMLLLSEMSAGRKDAPRFLFLSATPQKTLLDLAHLAGLRVRSVGGQYQHGEPAETDGWRRIVQPVSLHLHTGRIEDWVAAHLDDILLNFYAQHRPGAKGVIIVNSVATAHRLYAMLKERCAQEQVSIALNTGLVPREERTTDVDLLIATSTVDVGVDFRVNLLVFESTDAASHMQRLGRLGRHEDDGHGHCFDQQFEAHALLPPWVVEALAKQFPEESEVDRETYQKALNDTFPLLQEFRNYARCWSGLQAAHVLGVLNQKEIKTQYEQISQRLRKSYQTLFGPGFIKRYLVTNKEHPDLLAEATSFRGGSPLMALVLDRASSTQTVVAYNLLGLLRNAELVEAELETLYALAQRQEQSVEALKRSDPLIGYHLVGWLPKPRQVEVHLDARVDDWGADRFGVALEQEGFRLEAEGAQGLLNLNRALEHRTLVATLVRGELPDQLRRRLRLGYQFELLKFTSNDNVEGSVAFAREALLLDSLLYRTRASGGGNPMIY